MTFNTSKDKHPHSARQSTTAPSYPEHYQSLKLTAVSDAASAANVSEKLTKHPTITICFNQLSERMRELLNVVLDARLGVSFRLS